jgi:hypothetical protein
MMVSDFWKVLFLAAFASMVAAFVFIGVVALIARKLDDRRWQRWNEQDELARRAWREERRS